MRSSRYAHAPEVRAAAAAAGGSALATGATGNFDRRPAYLTVEVCRADDAFKYRSCTAVTHVLLCFQYCILCPQWEFSSEGVNVDSISAFHQSAGGLQNNNTYTKARRLIRARSGKNGRILLLVAAKGTRSNAGFAFFRGRKAQANLGPRTFVFRFPCVRSW